MTNRTSLSPEKKSRVKLSDSGAYLGVSPTTLSRIVSRGDLSCTIDSLNRRRNLVAVADLKRLRQQSLLAEEGGLN
jgi:hypothetical protein